MAFEEGDVEGAALEGLVRLVAASGRFQTRCNVENAEDAEARIYWPWVQEDIELKRPCAIIEDSEFDYVAVAGGSENYLMPMGSLILTLTDNDRFDGQEKEGWRDFLKWQSQVIYDVAEKAGSDDHLDIVAIRRVQRAIANPPQQSPAVKPYWWSKWEVIWSTRGGQ